MKVYIVGIAILFSIGTYFFITSNEKNITPNKVEPSKTKEYISSIDTPIEEEQKADYNEQKVLIVKKNKIASKQVAIEENKELQVFDENSAPLDILNKIFSFKDKDEMAFQKTIADLESILVSKLQSESEQDTYNMFKKLLNLEDTTIEDKKYVIDLLEAIGTEESKILLVETYQNSEEKELKEKISKLDTPEVNILLALEANQNDDKDNYQLMMNKLKDKNEEEVIGGFMAFTKSDDTDSLDTITQLTEKWSSKNLSQRSAEISESYLARGDAKPRERIVAISILSKMKNREERDRILTKALEHEDNENVLNFIQTTLDSEN